MKGVNVNIQFQLESLGEDSATQRMATMGNRVLEVLKQAIVQLQLRPGHLLSEAEVAKQLGVSRQPVREAFIKLSELGLVEIRPQRGTFVTFISRRAVENARFLREAIETAIVKKAALDANPEDIEAIAQTLTQQRAAHEKGDMVKFLQADEAFHQAIARSADCEYAWRILDGLKVEMDRVRFLSMPLATPVESLIQQHQAILDAISAKSPEQAIAAMQVHLSEILKSLPRIVEAHSDMFIA